ncbi:MAG: putative polymerase, sigma-24 subunit, subfamily [Verrucomicrobiaceae bacterium]|nr:putative polymerase, sigma-24 subunit, subfamily [Verrucomicrobiaceae bacterium]
MDISAAGLPAGDIARMTDHLFRHEAGKLVSVLTGIFGIERLQMAEDVVQEALARALQTWPFHGIPEKPAAWLMQTARNQALDLIRREKLFREKQDAITAAIEGRMADVREGAAPMFEDEIKDDNLRLMFACCHPLIPQEAQTALALKTLCGFSPAEIAKAFLTSEAAIAKRLTRARQRIQEQGIPFEIPAGAELAVRLDGVLQIIYLLFNEGYKASGGENLVRADLCLEAIRLAGLLAGHPSTDLPHTHALMALMLLDAARLPARTDGEGNMLRLQDQDRKLWDYHMITRGVMHLNQSAVGEELSAYHLQAGIAACHCMAPDYESTDWRRILSLYDRLAEVNGSPVVGLNRAVAMAKVDGPEKGLEAVEAIEGRGGLESYYLLHAVLGEFQMQLRRFPLAAQHWQRAIELAALPSEQAFLRQRLKECEALADEAVTS